VKILTKEVGGKSGLMRLKIPWPHALWNWLKIIIVIFA